MKKVTLYIILSLCLVMLFGCKRKVPVLTIEDVQANTILVKNDGTVQAATVEAFGEKYYDLSELNDFIIKQMDAYNRKAEVDAISLGTESLVLKDGNAVLVLNYANLEHYSKFNEVKATLLSRDAALSGDAELPEAYISADDGSFVSKEIALKNEKYKVLVINENTDVIVDGTIKYYTNSVLVSKSKLQTAAEGETVVIYKP